MLINPAFAQEAAAVAAPAVDPAVAASPIRLLLQFLVIFAVFYFFLIRPQQKKLKEHQAMQKNISRGDTIVTVGGVVGKVIRSNADDLLVEIADGVRVVVVRDRVLNRRTQPSADFTEEESVNDNAKKGSEGLKDVLTKKK
ncbi:MAG: preprotein translocase subunit YajC [Alphaproteobacteria bacterium]|nr:preprotein translocase subunit YajC [Alphaproteobacteria bacterium]MBO4643037.1 preprotein translocase subunit YajC [Alphaproteobacteria bacterium]